MSKFELGETVGIRVEGKYFEGVVAGIKYAVDDTPPVYTVAIVVEDVDGEHETIEFTREEHELESRHKSDYERIFHPRTDE